MAYDPPTKTVVLFGGGAADGTPLNDTWAWDGDTQTKQFPPISPHRWFDVPGTVYDPIDGALGMFGGGIRDTWEWDGLAKTWSQVFPATLPPPRGNGQLLI